MMKHRFEHTARLGRECDRGLVGPPLTGRKGSRIRVFLRSFIYVRTIGPRSNIPTGSDSVNRILEQTVQAAALGLTAPIHNVQTFLRPPVRSGEVPFLSQVAEPLTSVCLLRRELNRTEGATMKNEDEDKLKRKSAAEAANVSRHSRHGGDRHPEPSHPTRRQFLMRLWHSLDGGRG